MVDPKKGHIFHWEKRDFEPLRALFSWAVALGLLFCLFSYLPLPFTEGSKQLKEGREKALRNTSGNKSLNFLTLDEVTRLRSDADFTMDDPYQLKEYYIKKAEAQAGSQVKKIASQYIKERPRHEIQYTTIPYSPPIAIDDATLDPDLFIRELPSSLVTSSLTSPPSALRIALEKGFPPLLNPDLKIPFSEIGKGKTVLRFQVTVSPSGVVEYVLPLDMGPEVQKFTSWLKGLRFTSSQSGAQGMITLKHTVSE